MSLAKILNSEVFSMRPCPKSNVPPLVGVAANIAMTPTPEVDRLDQKFRAATLQQVVDGLLGRILDLDAEVSDGDEVAFMPPVCGG